MDRDTFDTLLAFAFIPAFTVTVLSLPAWLPFRKRVHWHLWEYGVPAAIVLVSMLLSPFLPTVSERSFGNYAAELIVSSVAALLIPWFRVAVPGKTSRSSFLLACTSFLLAIGLAALLWIVLPLLPE